MEAGSVGCVGGKNICRVRRGGVDGGAASAGSTQSWVREGGGGVNAFDVETRRKGPGMGQARPPQRFLVLRPQNNKTHCQQVLTKATCTMHYAPKHFSSTFHALFQRCQLTADNNVCRFSYHMPRTKAKKGVRKILVMVPYRKRSGDTRVCTNNAVQDEQIAVAPEPQNSVAEPQNAELIRLAELLGRNEGHFLQNNGAVVRTLPSPLPSSSPSSYSPTSLGFSPGIGDEED